MGLLEWKKQELALWRLHAISLDCLRLEISACQEVNPDVVTGIKPWSLDNSFIAYHFFRFSSSFSFAGWGFSFSISYELRVCVSKGCNLKCLCTTAGLAIS